MLMLRDLGSWERSMYDHPSRCPKCTHRIAGDGGVASGSYVMSFESERFYRGWRYYWMICAARNPDELVSWGYAGTRELAESRRFSVLPAYCLPLDKGIHPVSISPITRELVRH